MVTIGTRDHWHAKIAIEAMQAGKDVYCEKPMTLTIEEGRQIAQIVKQTGCVMQVGTQQRSGEYGGQFLTAVAMVRAGRIGKVHRVTVGLSSPLQGGPFSTRPVPSCLNWDMWFGQAPRVDYCPERCGPGARWWYEYAGGQITNWGSHHVDIAQWAIGMEQSGPTAVTGTATHPNIPNGYNTATAFDYNGDGSVDGTDFLMWQRGESPNLLSAFDLAGWELNFGSTSGGSFAGGISAVPEPSAFALFAMTTGIVCVAMRKNHWPGTVLSGRVAWHRH